MTFEPGPEYVQVPWRLVMLFGGPWDGMLVPVDPAADPLGVIMPHPDPAVAERLWYAPDSAGRWRWSGALAE